MTVDDEFETLVIKMNSPRVTVDNASSKKVTLVKVDSANKHGSLLEVVQVLTDMNLIIRCAYISSYGEWFMDVFHVLAVANRRTSRLQNARYSQLNLSRVLKTQCIIGWPFSNVPRVFKMRGRFNYNLAF